MKNFQSINSEKFNAIPQDQMTSVTGGALAVELTNIRDTAVCGCEGGGTVTDATLD